MTAKPPSPRALAKTIADHDQQLRHLRTQAPFSWDNFRWETGKNISTNNGQGWIDFADPFDVECFVCVVQQYPPGGISLVLGAMWFDKKGFQLVIEGAFTGGFQINYIAIGV